MQNLQNLQQQLHALEKLKSDLIRFNNYINDLSVQYKALIDPMVESGLPIQIANSYKNSFLQHNVSVLSSLAKMVEQEDLPYINRNIDALQELIRRTSAR